MAELFGMVAPRWERLFCVMVWLRVGCAELLLRSGLGWGSLLL